MSACRSVDASVCKREIEIGGRDLGGDLGVQVQVSAPIRVIVRLKNSAGTACAARRVSNLPALKVYRMEDFWIGVAETVLGLFSVAGLVALWEWYRTTERLRKFVTDYIGAVEFEWQNQTEEFALMHRVRAFEVLLRKVLILRPRTPGAYRRVEQVREALERLHMSIPIWRGRHLPLPKLGEFPFATDSAFEPQFRENLVKRLTAIKWLRFDELRDRSRTKA